MKELTEQQVLAVLDCQMNPQSEVECATCPLYGIKVAGGCRKLAQRAITHHIQKQRLQLDAVCVSLIEAEKEKIDESYAVCVEMKNGCIYAKTLKDYDNLIGDISRSAIFEITEEISNSLWENRSDNVRILFNGRYVDKAGFTKMIRSLGGFE